jgi:hypothetical protein
MDGAVSSAGAKDRVYFGIVYHLLQVCSPFRIGAAEDEILFADGVTYPDAEAPALDELYGRFYLFGGYVTGGAGDADRVAIAKVWRDKE